MPANAIIPTRAPTIARNFYPSENGLSDTNNHCGNTRYGSNRNRDASHCGSAGNGCSCSTSNVPQPRLRELCFRTEMLPVRQGWSSLGRYLDKSRLPGLSCRRVANYQLRRIGFRGRATAIAVSRRIGIRPRLVEHDFGGLGCR
jgi:hypothetical protein